MENRANMFCPFCKTEIMENEASTICPACGTPHHKDCWQENKGCTTFGCTHSHHAPKQEVVKTACVKCGSGLEEEQQFCPKCGTKKVEVKKIFCVKCGSELLAGQEFCGKCGHKAGVSIEPTVSSAIHQLNTAVQTKGKAISQKTLIGIVAVIGLVLVFAFLGSSPKNFKQRYSKLNPKFYTIASDGTWMKVDTNPNDIDDYMSLEVYQFVETINKDLGFSSSVYIEMGQTAARDGKITRQSKNYEVTWTYHPDNGMEALYKIKGK